MTSSTSCPAERSVCSTSQTGRLRLPRPPFTGRLQGEQSCSTGLQKALTCREENVHLAGLSNVLKQPRHLGWQQDTPSGVLPASPSTGTKPGRSLVMKRQIPKATWRQQRTPSDHRTGWKHRTGGRRGDSRTCRDRPRGRARSRLGPAARAPGLAWFATAPPQFGTVRVPASVLFTRELAQRFAVDSGARHRISGPQGSTVEKDGRGQVCGPRCLRFFRRPCEHPLNGGTVGACWPHGGRPRAVPPWPPRLRPKPRLRRRRPWRRCCISSEHRAIFPRTQRGERLIQDA